MSLFEKLVDNAILPVRKTKESAGYDLYSIEAKTIRASDYATELTSFKTGIQCNIPPGYCGQFWCKSSMGVQGIIVHAGLIDSDYPGELIVLLSSLYTDIKIEVGGKLAQMVIVPYYSDDDTPVDAIRKGGFGSTDKLAAELPKANAFVNRSIIDCSRLSKSAIDEAMMASVGPL